MAEGIPPRSTRALLYFTGNYIFSPMLLIVAAMAEELRVAMDLCSRRAKVRCGGIRIWEGVRGENLFYMAKTGTGPVHSAAGLAHVLSAFRPSQILVVGYAGALAPDLKTGDLIALTRASSFGQRDDKALPLEQMSLSGSWELSDIPGLSDAARAAGLTVHYGEILTSPYVIGKPEQKKLLNRRFRAAAVDMETAALARVAAERSVPISCVRSVTDESEDTFLIPFSYDPASSAIRRVTDMMAAGHLIGRRQKWKQHAAIARQSLQRLLAAYLGGQTRIAPR